MKAMPRSSCASPFPAWLFRLSVRIQLRRKQRRDDTVLEKCGVSLLIDPMSFLYLMGAEIDYKESLEGARFVINNPNAVSTCGCGESFSV